MLVKRPPFFLRLRRFSLSDAITGALDVMGYSNAVFGRCGAFSRVDGRLALWGGDLRVISARRVALVVY